jgi:hypothetical protein
VVEHANAWLHSNKRLDRQNDRLTTIIEALLTAACIFGIAVITSVCTNPLAARLGLDGHRNGTGVA